MFTGIVQDLGRVTGREVRGGDVRLERVLTLAGDDLVGSFGQVVAGHRPAVE